MYWLGSNVSDDCASISCWASFNSAGFTSVSGANGPSSDRFRLRRYNVEPYPPRTFELVLSGACDLIAAKDTVAGTHARRLFNQVLGTATR